MAKCPYCKNELAPEDYLIEKENIKLPILKFAQSTKILAIKCRHCGTLLGFAE